ncbi:hypothetical protein DFH07DRAFT_1030200 [Mycena maculata]|uniref:Non-haem dioxygenase N-terminal domain-containing protein n=1 Tax=Mycena maculata TaxID=230809 RepID=A0AAD7K6V2_9AGAR|nr:hypothetical protein DFH07DRAFT_1030200 [Mycena maculata]
MSLATAMEIPVIDLSDSSARQETIARQIRHACETVGFFYIKDHKIPDAVVDRALAASAEFFALSDDTKLRLYQEEPISINLGYRPGLNTEVDESGTADLQNGLVLQWADRDADPTTGNKWPAELRPAQFGTQLYRLTSLVMGLREYFFTDKEVMGSGPHSDFGVSFFISKVIMGILNVGRVSSQTFTILLQRPDMEALQYHPGPNDSLHQRRNPVRAVPRRQPPQPRPALHPVLFLADFDVVLQPDASFITPARPRQYAPMTAKEQLEKRLAELQTK